MLRYNILSSHFMVGLAIWIYDMIHHSCEKREYDLVILQERVTELNQANILLL